MKPWSPSFIAFVEPLTPEQVLRPSRENGCAGPGVTPESRREFYQIQTAQRLSWLYGQERAAQIMSGEDDASRADAAAWAQLGTRRAA